MKAMILAAGRGTRMRPLTDKIPKPLVKVGNKALIEYHLEALSTAGFKEVVINVCVHAEQIMQTLGNGHNYNLEIHYSQEPENAPLETGGGILQALPLLGPEPFLVINGDIWTNFPFVKLPKTISGLAHIILVNNPAHNAQGDFYLTDGFVHDQGTGSKLTYAGINIFHPRLFSNCKPGVFRVPPLLIEPMQQNLVTGEHYDGQWMDVGTIERLTALNAYINK